MKREQEDVLRYVYTYACHETERELCKLEMKQLFGSRPVHESLMIADRQLEPGISPFIHLRLEVLSEANTVEGLCAGATSIELRPGESFKVICLKEGDSTADYQQRREMERTVGACIHGSARMKQPDVVFGIIQYGQRWLLGRCEYSDRSWMDRRHKPQNYSTGLPVHVAKVLVNLAAPFPVGAKILDPCCGMGNVLIEALTSGADIHGCDINPLAVRGARVNLRHFGWAEDRVELGDMNSLTGTYEAAVLDMPYNLCSVLPPEDQRNMLCSLRRLSARAVVVSTQPLGQLLTDTGWHVIEHCTLGKSSMNRYIWICE